MNKNDNILMRYYNGTGADSDNTPDPEFNQPSSAESGNQAGFVLAEGSGHNAERF